VANADSRATRETTWRAVFAIVLVIAAAGALVFGAAFHTITVFVTAKPANAAPSAPPPGAPPLLGAAPSPMIQQETPPQPTELVLSEATAISDITVGRLTRGEDGKVMRGEAAAACPT
jgi:hypothetical protein